MGRMTSGAGLTLRRRRSSQPDARTRSSQVRRPRCEATLDTPPDRSRFSAHVRALAGDSSSKGKKRDTSARRYSRGRPTARRTRRSARLLHVAAPGSGDARRSGLTCRQDGASAGRPGAGGRGEWPACMCRASNYIDACIRCARRRMRGCERCAQWILSVLDLP